MSRKKYSKEFKLKLVKEHLEEGTSYWRLSKDYGIEASIIRRWGDAFDAFGEEGIEPHNCDLYNYSAEFKKKVVEEYLATSTSLKELAYKYKILASSSVGKWVRMYNNHEELKESRPKGDYLMIKESPTRKTTLEERIAIVEYCIAHSYDYAATAKEYNCSYGQVYSWAGKYTQNGISGLYDKRGRNKLNEELSEIEKLRAENRMLKAQSKQQKMEIDLLKKLEDIERR